MLELLRFSHVVTRFATEDNINKIYEIAKTQLSLPLEEVAKSICEGHLQNFWAHTISTEQDRERLKGNLKRLQDVFSDLPLEDQTTEVAEKLQSDIRVAQSESLRESKRRTLEAVAASRTNPRSISEVASASLVTAQQSPAMLHNPTQLPSAPAR